MTKERIFGMDLVRVYALVLIIIYHFNISLEEWGGVKLQFPFISQSSMGAVGVGLYLLISGAALTYNYNGNVIQFYKKRIKSLMVPFYIAYGMVLIFNFIIGEKPADLPLWKYVYTLLGMDGFLSYRTPTFYLIGEWFLGFIIICYIFFPLYNVCIKKIPWTFLTVVGIIFLYNITVYQYEIPMLWNPLVLTPYFALGICFMEYIYQNIRAEIFLAALLGAYACHRYIFTNIMNDILVGTSLLFIVVFMLGKFVGKSRVRVVFEGLSKYSYGIILFHHVVIYRLFRYLGKGWATAGRKYAVLLMVCVISFALAVLLSKIEKNIWKAFSIFKTKICKTAK